MAQQQDVILKQKQMFLTNLQSILVSSQQTHSTWSSWSSWQGINDMPTGSSGSSREGTNSISYNKNQDKIYHDRAGDKRKHPSDDESCDDDYGYQ